MSNEQLAATIVGTAITVLGLRFAMYRHLDHKIDKLRDSLGELSAAISKIQGRFEGQDFSTLSNVLNQVAGQ